MNPAAVPSGCVGIASKVVRVREPRLLRAQRQHRIDTGGAAGGNRARHEAGEPQRHQRHEEARGSFAWVRNRKLSAAALRYHAPTVPMSRPAVTSRQAFVITMPTTVAACRSEGHSDANLARALRYHVGYNTVDSHGRDDQPKQAKQAEQQHVETALRHVPGHQLLHRLHIAQRHVWQDSQHGCFHCRQHCVRVAAGMNHQRGTRRGLLGDRQ